MCSNKRDTFKYNLIVNYTKKGIGQKFVDYLGSTNFSCLDFNLKNLLRMNNETNVNKSVSNFYFTNL
jgi:hypothetical protein